MIAPKNWFEWDEIIQLQIIALFYCKIFNYFFNGVKLSNETTNPRSKSLS